MKDLMTFAVIAVSAFVIGLLIPSKQPAQPVIPAGSVGTFAEVYSVTDSTDYTLCGVDASLSDFEVILVSPDMGKCGESMTIVLVDGSVVSAPISGVLHNVPAKRIEIYNLDTPQVTEVFKH